MSDEKATPERPEGCEKIDIIQKNPLITEPCGLPVVCVTTKHITKYYCEQHGMLALIAGLEPEWFDS